MAKQEEHTGFRNGDLFCFHCGDSHKMKLPMRATDAASVMLDFSKRHKKCPKTWEEPSPEETKQFSSVERKMKWWMENGNKGRSSIAMFDVFDGRKIPHIDNDLMPPADPSDFKRCHDLLCAIPEFRDRLPEMKKVSPVWEKLVDNWEKLTELLEEQVKTGKPNGMYELMKELGC